MNIPFPKTAFVIATGQGKNPYERCLPTPLMKIADKPILAYILESLHAKKCMHIHLILHHKPETIEQFFGNGDRFGVTLYYHLAKDKKNPLNPVKAKLRSLKNEWVVLGQGDELISLNTICHHQNSSGWSIQKAEELLKNHFVPRKNTESLLSTKTLQSLFTSNFKFIKKTNLSLLPPSSCYLVQEGIYLSRGVSLHPKSTLIPPVFIGEECHLAKNVTVGPNVVIENRCYVDESSNIKDSIILQSSYVGAGLEITKSLVDRNLLIKVDEEHSIQITDDFILSDLSLPKTSHLLEKWIAKILLFFISPLFLFLKAKNIECVKLPSGDRLQTFNLHQFDGVFKHFATLKNIAKGEVHFVGIKPRTKKEIEALPPDWKKLILQSKVGMMTMSSTQDEDLLYAEEAYYTVNQGFWFDLNLFIKRTWYGFKKIIPIRSQIFQSKLPRNNSKHSL